ncbi:MAG: DUF2004 domain-containing protein [Planctomycetes bacterium]|nr:DUF2004 domain-containing protein [Planctomycetota bacterium]
MSEPYVDPIFGPLRAAANGYWGTTAMVGGTSVELDMTLDGAIDAAAIARLTGHLRDLPQLEARARAALLADVDEEDSAVLLYRSFHAGELDAEELAKCFGGSDAWRSDPSALIAALRLQRIGVYPEHDDVAIVVDFTLAPELTDHLLSVFLDPDGDVIAVNVES